jgi:hypothetical protein
MFITTDFRDIRDINHERNKNPFNLEYLCSDKKKLSECIMTEPP